MNPAQDVLALLRSRRAESIPHPGGTLLAHLVRVFERLQRLGASTELQHAGLAHAVYGTDGFDVVLLDRDDRDSLRRLVGPAAEQLVYRYGGCDRERTWPQLALTRQVWSRFDGSVETLDEEGLRDFVDLTVVNEVDALEHFPELAARHGDFFRSLFASWKQLGSPAVMADALARPCRS